MKRVLLFAGCLFAAMSMAAQDNLMTKANEGTTGDKGAMAAAGWQAWTFKTDGAGTQLTWNSNGPDGNNVRWENKPTAVTYDGNSYTGNIAFTRWDGGKDTNLRNLWYIFPVEIKTPGTYRFSVLAGGWSNLNTEEGTFVNGSASQAELLMLFAKERGPKGVLWTGTSEFSTLGLPETGSGKLFDLPKTDGNDHATLIKCECEVTAQYPGTYYVELTGSRAIIATADYQLEFVKGRENTGSENLIADANAGEVSTPADMPRHGWEYWKFPYTKDGDSYNFSAGTNVAWNSGVRWENMGDKVEYEGTSYNGNVALIRWDNGTSHPNWFVYPVEITTPGKYRLSVLAGPWSNVSEDADNAYLKGSGKTTYLGLLFSGKPGPEGITWNATEDQPYSVLGAPAAGQGKVFSLEKTDDNNHAILQKFETDVEAPVAGTYYVEIIGSHSIFATADYSLTLKDTSAVSEIYDNAEVSATEYYGIDGVRIMNPAKGALVIEKRVMTDGNVKVSKKIIR